MARIVQYTKNFIRIVYDVPDALLTARLFIYWYDKKVQRLFIEGLIILAWNNRLLQIFFEKVACFYIIKSFQHI